MRSMQEQREVVPQQMDIPTQRHLSDIHADSHRRAISSIVYAIQTYAPDFSWRNSESGMGWLRGSQ